MYTPKSQFWQLKIALSIYLGSDKNKIHHDFKHVWANKRIRKFCFSSFLKSFKWVTKRENKENLKAAFHYKYGTVNIKYGHDEMMNK